MAENCNVYIHRLSALLDRLTPTTALDGLILYVTFTIQDICMKKFDAEN